MGVCGLAALETSTVRAAPTMTHVTALASGPHDDHAHVLVQSGSGGTSGDGDGSTSRGIGIPRLAGLFYHEPHPSPRAPP